MVDRARRVGGVRPLTSFVSRQLGSVPGRSRLTGISSGGAGGS